MSLPIKSFNQCREVGKQVQTACQRATREDEFMGHSSWLLEVVPKNRATQSQEELEVDEKTK
jgi:hypothetical protein